MQRFTDLKVWQRSHALALRVYQLTKALPSLDKFLPEQYPPETAVAFLALRTTDDIRARADKAARSEILPNDRECMNAYNMTREILQHLYE